PPRRAGHECAALSGSAPPPARNFSAGGASASLRPAPGRVQSPVNVPDNFFLADEGVMRNHRRLCSLLLAVVLGLVYGGTARAADKVVKYARFRAGKVPAYGVVEGDVIHQISPNPFVKWKKTGQTY